MIKFCSECGKKTEYSFSPPKFCSACGAPMGVAHLNESKPLNRNVSSTRKAQAISDDETDAESVPHISKLEYEIDQEYNHTMASLAGREPPKRRRSNSKSIDDLAG